MADILLSRMRVLAAKIEATPGVAESLTAAEGAMCVYRPEIRQDAEVVQRDSQGGFNQYAANVSARLGTVTFQTEMIAPSVAPLWALTLLRGCGFKATGSGTTTAGAGEIAEQYVLDPVPPGGAGSGQKTLTVGVFQNGRYKYIYGAMGNVRFLFDAARRAMMEFTFRGIWGGVTDAAIIAPTYPTAPPLRFVASSLLIGAWSPKVKNLVLDCGNEVYVREDSSQLSGYHHAVISNRRVNGHIDPEAQKVATKDVYGEWLLGTLANLSFKLGSGDDVVYVSASNLQWMSPNDGDRSNVHTDEIDFQLLSDDLTLGVTTTAATTMAP